MVIFLSQVIANLLVMVEVSKSQASLIQASLKRPTNNQILLMETAYEFCITEITSVKVFLIEKDPLQNFREFLHKRCAMASIVPRTQSFHHFESDSVGVLQFKRVSDDKPFCGNHNFLIQIASLRASDISLMSCLLCL